MLRVLVFCPDRNLKEDYISYTIIRYANLLSSDNIGKQVTLFAKSNSCLCPLSDKIEFIRCESKKYYSMLKGQYSFSILCFKTKNNIYIKLFKNLARKCLILVEKRNDYNFIKNDKKYAKFIQDMNNNVYGIRFISPNRKIKIKEVNIIDPIDWNYRITNSILNRNINVLIFPYGKIYKNYVKKLINTLYSINNEVNFIDLSNNYLKRENLVELYNNSMFCVDLSNGTQMFRTKDAMRCGCIPIVKNNNKIAKYNIIIYDDPIKTAISINNVMEDVEQRGEIVYANFSTIQYNKEEYSAKIKNYLDYGTAI